MINHWNWLWFEKQNVNAIFNIYRFLLRSKTLGRPAGLEKTAEKLKGLQMIVCLDCKTMVLQIIKTSRTSRSQAIKNLSLNISPVYWLETALVTLS